MALVLVAQYFLLRLYNPTRQVQHVRQYPLKHQTEELLYHRWWLYSPLQVHQYFYCNVIIILFWKKQLLEHLNQQVPQTAFTVLFKNVLSQEILENQLFSSVCMLSLYLRQFYFLAVKENPNWTFTAISQNSLQ
jgi:hypothetical protein